MLTSDRSEGVRALYDIACRVLGSSLKCASLSMRRHYDESEPPALVLTIVADVDREEWKQVYKAIVEAEVEMEGSWSDYRRRDWQKAVYFSLFLPRA